jgi:hypothetical protein
MRRLILFMFLTIVPVSLGQQPPGSKCALTIAQSPVIRGIRLGMTTEQLLAQFPGSSEDEQIKRELASAKGSPNFGLARIGFQPSYGNYPASTKQRFAGINILSVALLDGKVVQIYVHYDPPGEPGLGVNWHNTDDFVRKISDGFNLPPPADWTSGSSYALTCNGFDIKASSQQGGYIYLSEKGYNNEISERRAADDKKRQDAFKP